jgi:intergrase/recombinase
MSKIDIISRVEESHKWIDENRSRLIREYNNRWISVLDRTVIDSDSELDRLTERLRKRLAHKYQEVVIEYISDKPLNIVLMF